MKQLRVLREAASISTATLATEMGVSQQAVGKWERGEAMPRADLLPKLADVLGCTIDALFGRDKSTA